MPLQPVATIKNWFKTGLKPTQSQFWDWLDSYFHKSDSIPMANVTSLDTTLSGLATIQYVDGLFIPESQTLNTSPSTYDVSAGKVLEYVIVESATPQTFYIENTPNAADIAEVELTANTPELIRIDVYAKVLKTIRFRYTGTVILKLYKR